MTQENIPEKREFTLKDFLIIHAMVGFVSVGATLLLFFLLPVYKPDKEFINVLKMAIVFHMFVTTLFTTLEMISIYVFGKQLRGSMSKKTP
jgi:hypothetical protein